MRIFLLVCALIAASAIIAYTLFENPHDFPEDKCSSCHVDQVNDPKKMTASTITELCRDCHKKIGKSASHPVDFVPETIKIPADLPLTAGKMTCNTCHNIHSGRYTFLGEKTYYLRRPSAGRNLCFACHAAGGFDNNKHAEVIAVAHLRSKYTTTDKSQPLDPMSMECIGCHDGSLGKDVSYNLGTGVWTHTNGAHPIGVNYKSSRMKLGGLKAFEKINKNIRFFSGRIGCGTCHDVYSKLPNQLVMSNDGSKLCLSCHDK